MTNHIHTETLLAVNAVQRASRYDPTHTTALRNEFARALNARFDELAGVMRQAVVDQDCFGLNDLHTMQVSAPAPKAFAFPRSADKVEAFMTWLQVQVERGILEVGEASQLGVGVEEPWTNRYVLDSYKRGVQRSRYEMKRAGIVVPSLEETGGLAMAMMTPVHLDRIGLLYSRVFTELRGITNAMDGQISRILSQGIADGDNHRLLARKLVTSINGTGAGDLGLDISYINKSGKQVSYFMSAKRRAEIMSRTEIIRAHHQAMIQEYRNWAVEGLIVRGEWKTAMGSQGKLNGVCPRCAELEGHVFTLDEIEGMIPLHVQCRCLALPYVEKKQPKNK